MPPSGGSSQYISSGCSFLLLLMWGQWSQNSSRSWTGGLRVLFLFPLPGGEHGTPLGAPAHNPCSVFPLSLSWVESSGCQYYCSVTVLGLQGLEMVMGRHEPKETAWASTAPSTPYTPDHRMVQSPSGILFPHALEDGHCLQNIPWCPLCESRALRTEIGWKVEQGAVEMLPVWGSSGFSSIRCSPQAPQSQCV